MPKESKKFINPLLRPSQEPEVKGEPAARPQKNLTPEPFFVETSILPETVHDVHAEVFQEEPPPEIPIPVTNYSPSTKTSTLTEAATSAKTPVNSLSVSSPVHSVTSFQDEQERIGEEQKRSVSVDLQASPLLHTASKPDTIVGDQPEESVSHPFPDIVAPPVPPYPRQNGAVAEADVHPLTYTETETDTSTTSLTSVQMTASVKPSTKSVRGEKKAARTSFTAAESVRRRRGALTFENTHERITLWIDKELKQSFEELAYERELPKTALLNEAVSDLLKKYDMQ